LPTESTDETGTRTTARVIAEVDADILAVVADEDRPALVRLNNELALADRRGGGGNGRHEVAARSRRAC